MPFKPTIVRSLDYYELTNIGNNRLRFQLAILVICSFFLLGASNLGTLRSNAPVPDIGEGDSEVAVTDTGTGEVTVKVDNADQVKFTEINWVEVFGEKEERFFESSDELDFAWSNSDSRTWGLEVKYRTRN